MQRRSRAAGNQPIVPMWSPIRTSQLYYRFDNMATILQFPTSPVEGQKMGEKVDEAPLYR